MRTTDEAELIITGILILLGLEERRFAVLTRTKQTGEVNVVAMDPDADRVLIDNEDKIWEASAKAGSAFTLKYVEGFPVLINRHG